MMMGIHIFIDLLLLFLAVTRGMEYINSNSKITPSTAEQRPLN